MKDRAEDRLLDHKDKLLALKAFYVGVDARLNGSREADHQLAGKAIAYMSPPTSAKEAKRLVFYHLVSAETSEHIGQAAIDLRAADRLSRFIDSTAHSWFEALKQAVAPSLEFRIAVEQRDTDRNPALKALNLAVGEMTQEDRTFIFKWSLTDIAKWHEFGDLPWIASQPSGPSN